MLLLPIQLLDMAGGGPPTGGGGGSTLLPYAKLSIGLRVSLSSWLLTLFLAIPRVRASGLFL